MAQGDVQVTIVGNVGNDPEIRFTPSGAAVCSFSLVSTPRKFNKQTNEWEDGAANWFRCTAWRAMAENVAESVTKGARVIVTGRLEIRRYETNEGTQGTSVDLQIDEIGPSLKWATAKVQKAGRQSEQRTSGATGTDDPWGQPPPAPSGGGQWSTDAPF